MTNKPNNQSAQEVDKTICPTCGASLFEHTPLQTKGREVEFAEWMDKEFKSLKLIRGYDGFAYFKNENSPAIQCTAEKLFQLFLTTNHSNKGA